MERDSDDLVKLREFQKKLKTYGTLVEKGFPTGEETERQENLRNWLCRNKARVKPAVVGLVGRRCVEDIFGKRHDVWSEAFRRDSLYQGEAIDMLVASVKTAISESERGGDDHVLSTSASVFPKAFIAQGGDSRALAKLREFLDGLGVDPLVVEKRPSQGRSVNANVEHYLKQADSAIVLATKGDIDGKTRELLPRANVSIELGRCEERFPGRMVYLLEDGATFSSDAREKVWERFTQDNMEAAFIKIAKELRAFGIIRTGKPGK